MMYFGMVVDQLRTCGQVKTIEVTFEAGSIEVYAQVVAYKVGAG